jgi:hypothetical protein
VVYLGRELREIARDVRLQLGILTRELRELGDVLRAGLEAFPLLEARAKVAETLQDLLGALAILPEIGSCGLGL